VLDELFTDRILVEANEAPLPSVLPKIGTHPCLLRSVGARVNAVGARVRDVGADGVLASVGPGAGSLSKMPSPSGPVQTLAQHLNQPAGLFVDATDVYFTVVTDGLRYTLAPSMLPR
jgi:hypothetical protein